MIKKLKYIVQRYRMDEDEDYMIDDYEDENEDAIYLDDLEGTSWSLNTVGTWKDLDMGELL